MTGKVAVLMGGPSAEREISLISGKAVLEALRGRGVDAHAFDPAQREILELRREGFERVFIALHGRFGEDGTVQGALETLRIPYTGSGVMASALAMDKWRTKLVWHATGIPTPRFAMVTASTEWGNVLDLLGLPVIVKPVREGSTLGITKVTRAADLPAAYELAARYDPLVMAEEFVAGQELTASILGETPLPLVRIEAPEGNYD
jgi:D-alanine-D-alanine ligase